MGLVNRYFLFLFFEGIVGFLSFVDGGATRRLLLEIVACPSKRSVEYSVRRPTFLDNFSDGELLLLVPAVTKREVPQSFLKVLKLGEAPEQGNTFDIRRSLICAIVFE